MKLKAILTGVLIISTLALASCANTVRGIGKDASNTADAIEDVVN